MLIGILTLLLETQRDTCSSLNIQSLYTHNPRQLILCQLYHSCSSNLMYQGKTKAYMQTEYSFKAKKVSWQEQHFIILKGAS